MADSRLQIILAAKDATGTALTKFQGRIAAITSSVFSFRGALGALTGAGGFGLLITKSLESADAIGKTADKLGISTTALQEYRYAAERSGVSTNTLDMALQRFTRRTAEAAAGKGELKGVLEEYNIAVRDAAGNTRSTQAVFRDLADVIQRTTDPAERLRIAFKAFDSEGAALVNMLRDGSAGLDDWSAKAQNLGIVLDDNLVRGAEKTKDAMDDLGKVIQTSFSRAVLENVTSLTSAVETLAGAFAKVAKYAGLRSVMGTFTQGAELARKGMLDWQEFVQAGFAERQRMVDDILAKMDQISAHEQFRLGKSSRGAPIGPQATAVVAAARLSSMELPTIKAPPNIKLLKNPAQIAEKEAAEYTAAFRQAVEEYGGDILAPEIIDAQLSRMEQSFERSSEKVGRSFESVTGNMTGALTDFVTTGEFSFKSFANSIISDLIRIQTRAVISGLANNIFGGSGGGLFAGLFHAGGVVGSTAVPTRSVPAGVFAGAPRLHQGLAADEFPAILQRGETVTPRGGGGSAPVFINITAMDSQDVFRALEKSGAVPALAAQNLNDNGLLRSAMLNNL